MSEFQTRLNMLLEEFELFDDWEERYRYIIDLGKDMAPLNASEKTEETRVLGCASQVWLVMDPAPRGILRFRGESDAFGTPSRRPSHFGNSGILDPRHASSARPGRSIVVAENEWTDLHGRTSETGNTRLMAFLYA